jgi:hypothetical protein
MKKELSNQNYSEITDDSEMLDEYDFSQGVRGKYFQKYQNNNLATLTGIQFLIDSKGRKTGVLLDIQKHCHLWLNVLEENQSHANTFQFLIDEKGQKTAVMLNFKEHLKIWESIYDNLIAEQLV